MPREAVVDRYFLEHRAKLIDIAAFLDRVDRAGAGADDFRMVAFRLAIGVLQEADPGRARRILDLLSDPTETPIPAAGTKGATGAYPGSSSAP